MQVLLNVVLSPGEPNAAKEPDNVRVLPPVHETESPETVSEPLSVTADAP